MFLKNRGEDVHNTQLSIEQLEDRRMLAKPWQSKRIPQFTCGYSNA